jgi:hypothetical protein
VRAAAGRGRRVCVGCRGSGVGGIGGGWVGGGGGERDAVVEEAAGGGDGRKGDDACLKVGGV